jgi:hypothetical protein
MLYPIKMIRYLKRVKKSLLGRHLYWYFAHADHNMSRTIDNVYKRKGQARMNL